MKIKTLFVIVFGLATTPMACSAKNHVTNSYQTSIQNTIEFEISPYGLLFTEIEVDGNRIKAMIDFGDPNILQISSTHVDRHGLVVKESKGVAMDIMGNQFKINSGIVKEVLIGTKTEQDVEFSSSPNEMESVSKQIGTEFHAVVGWGYFRKYYTTLEYSKLKFTLSEKPPDVVNNVASTHFIDSKSYLIIPVVINEKSVNALLDTGSPVSLVDRALGLDNLTKLKIGESEMQESFVSEDLSMLKDLGVSVLLGGTFLSNYRVHIDPVEMKITFE